MSLNLRLLFKINSLVGRNRWLDWFGLIGARWVIVFAVIYYIFIVYSDFGTWGVRPIICAFTLLIWVAGWLVSLLLGAALRRPRPFITHPELTKLFQPLTIWKSFPSDHAFTVWLLVFLSGAFRLEGAWFLLPLALWISWGRVYTAVHYPGDIIGGGALAGLAVGVLYGVGYFYR